LAFFEGGKPSCQRRKKEGKTEEARVKGWQIWWSEGGNVSSWMFLLLDRNRVVSWESTVSRSVQCYGNHKGWETIWKWWKNIWSWGLMTSGFWFLVWERGSSLWTMCCRRLIGWAVYCVHMCRIALYGHTVMMILLLF